jgi:hypothetical protein
MPRSILLHVRCPHCLKLFQQTVPVPGEASALDDCELIESAFIREMKFVCPKDETPFGEIVAFKVLEGDGRRQAA